MSEMNLNFQLRSLLPRSLQHRAPVQYELFDWKGRRIAPTLAGYYLSPGKDYRLKITMQQDTATGWRAAISPASSTPFLDWHWDEGEDGQSRTIALRTNHLRRNPRLLFGQSAFDLPVKIRFTDRRTPYETCIPIVLANRWRYAPLLILSVLAAIPLRRSLSPAVSLAVAAGLFFVVGLTCFILDHVRSFRRASRSIAALHAEFAVPEPKPEH
jgi:hypothetical protein